MLIGTVSQTISLNYKPKNKYLKYPNFKIGDLIRLKTRGKNAKKEIPILEYTQNNKLSPDISPEININVKFMFTQKNIAIFLKFGDNEDHRKMLRTGMWVLFNGNIEYVNKTYWKYCIKI